MLVVEGARGREGAMRYCEVEDCIRPAAPGGKKCWAHYKHLERYGAVRPVNQWPSEVVRQRFLDAVIAYADADSDDDAAYRQAERELWDAFADASQMANAVLALSKRPTKLRRR